MLKNATVTYTHVRCVGEAQKARQVGKQAGTTQATGQDTDLLDEVDGQGARHGEEHEERQEQRLLEVALFAFAVGGRHLVQHLMGRCQKNKKKKKNTRHKARREQLEVRHTNKRIVLGPGDAG